MIELLHIRNMATVTELEVEFGSHFNTVTGETGAGKSLMLGALQILLGGRADKGLIRTGEKRCEIAGSFRILPDYTHLKQEIATCLAQADIEFNSTTETPELLLRRVITTSGSRAYINGSSVTVERLRKLGNLLLDIHGPNDHQSLLQPSCQLDLLDAFAGLKALRETCQNQWTRLSKLSGELEEVMANELSPAEQELLTYQLEEIDNAELRPTEEEELTEQYDFLANGKRILELSSQCVYALNDSDESIIEMLRPCAQQLSEIRDLVPERGGPLADAIESIVTDLESLSYDLTSFQDTIELDQEELLNLEERLGLIAKLKRKYGSSVNSVLEYADQLRYRLNAAGDRTERINELQQEIEDTKAGHLATSTELHDKRVTHSEALAEAVCDKLQRLGFKQSQFDIAFTTCERGGTGQDKVEFLFAPNPGETPQPLRKIGSSGEIARVMLAIKTVLTAADEVPVLVFDEVDANVGGETARAVADEIISIARQHQVLSITHLPQIAATAQYHFKVSKDIVNDRTITSVDLLSHEERVDEIARMLGEPADSSIGRQHATEMLERSELPTQPCTK